jgi:hypothetical protein
VGLDTKIIFIGELEVTKFANGVWLAAILKMAEK